MIDQSLAHPPTGQEEHPHACIAGTVYIGHMVEDPESGEEVEVYEAVPCRRCQPGLETSR